MRIIVASAGTPFLADSASSIVDSLALALKTRGHEVEVFPIPFGGPPPEVLEQFIALRLLDLSRHGDRLITVRTPSCLLRHLNKVCWFVPHHSDLDDLSNLHRRDVASTPEGVRYRDSIRSARDAAFREARQVFCCSRAVAASLKTGNGIEARVLYPPLEHPELCRSDGYGDYVLSTGPWIHRNCRWLAIEALRLVKTPVRLVIAESPGAESGEQELRDLVKMNRLEDRIEFRDVEAPTADYANLRAGCLAAIHFSPLRGSSTPLVLASFQSGKCVIAATDIQGTDDLVTNGETGFLTVPEPEMIAEALDLLFLNRAVAQKMGEAGRRRVLELDITWDNVLRELLS